MRTQHGGAHPSARLVEGPADFWEALELVEAQFAFEQAAARWGPQDRAAQSAMEAGHAQISAATGRARRLWLEEQEAARLRTVDRLRLDALATSAFGVRDSAFGEAVDAEATAIPEGRTPNAERGRTPSKEAALDDEAARWLGLLATALEDGDYAGLAI